MSSLWLSLAPIVVINAFTITTLIVFLVRRRRLPPAQELEGRFQSRILGRTLQEYWYWLTTPIAEAFIQMRLSPNILTTIGTGIGVFSAYLFAHGWFGYAGWALIAGATFDLFDGKVARLTNQVRRSGAFYDSAMDRLSEGLVFLGLAIYFRGTWLLPVVILGLIGSMLVSYARARGEAVGVVCKKGPMQRPERIAYLGIATVLQPVADATVQVWYHLPPAFLVVSVLCVIALLTLYTAIYRTVYIMNKLDSVDKPLGEIDTLPQMISKATTKEGREALLTKMRHYPH